MGDLFAVVSMSGDAAEPGPLLRAMGSGHARLRACGDDRAAVAWERGDDIRFAAEEGAWLVAMGHPRLAGEVLAEPAALLDLYRRHGPDFVAYVRGHFLLFAGGRKTHGFVAANDRSGIYPLHVAGIEGGLALSMRLSPLRRLPGSRPGISADALYAYLYFTRIPAPLTVFSGISKFGPAMRLVCHGGDYGTERYWIPAYSAERRGDRKDEEELRTLLDETMARIVAQSGGKPVGAFLSGGLDSSTVCILLHRHLGERLHMFNVSFHEEAFDESPYARAVARTIEAPYHELRMAVADLPPILDRLARSYEEPYGNSSAAAALFAAERARALGIEVMVGGDGGDELFGGNERYRQQKIFQAWHRIPAPLRRTVAAAVRWPALPETRLLRKARGYVRRAEMPLPERLETYNFFEETPVEAILEDPVRNRLDPEATPHRLMREHFERIEGGEIDRMMYLDLQTTVADDDLRKVLVTCASRGILPRFPFLEDEIVAFANAIPGTRHVPRHALRDFYRRAMTPILPEATLQKSKKGFGLPFSHWLRHEPALHAGVRDALARLRERGLFRDRFLDALLAGFESERAAYFAEPIWLLMMLERWYEEHWDRGPSAAREPSLVWEGPSLST